MNGTAPVRTPVLAGNWKMHKGLRETASFFEVFLPAFPPHADRTVIFFPPAVSLATAAAALARRPDISLGVQNIHWESSGAFTGEIAGPMAAEAGAGFALVGHSERRHVFSESDEIVGRKVRAAFRAGMVPVVCVGETLDERRAGRLETVLGQQVRAVFEALDDDDHIARLVLAYEPVWAIGTGVNAAPADAAAAHGFLRRLLGNRVGARHASRTPILYGGSVKPENAGELLAASDVDGLLVGGASLDPVGFARIAAVDTS